MLDTLVSLHQSLDDVGLISSLVGLAIVAWNQHHRNKTLAVGAVLETVTDTGQQVLDKGEAVMKVLGEAQSAMRDGKITSEEFQKGSDFLLKIQNRIADNKPATDA